jgi:spermidine/putrescine transport system permease protein
MYASTEGEPSGGLRRRLLGGYAMLVFAFIYVPIAIVVVFSFNTSKISVWPLEGVTLDWYDKLLHDERIHSALLLSLEVAAVATLLAGVLGTLLAYAAHRFDFPGKRLLQRVVLMPLVVPGVVTGIALLTMFDQGDVPLSGVTIVLGHITFLIAVFFTTVFARLQGLGVAIERSAMDLGASETRAFFAVILPNLRLTLIGSAVIAFTLSFDEIPITFFLTGTENTVPMLIYSMLRTGLTPEVNALATVSLLISLTPIVIGALVARHIQRTRVPA